MTEEHSVTLRVRQAKLALSGSGASMEPPQFELLIDGKPFTQGLQNVKVEMDAASMLPLVTISFFPQELIVEAEKAILALMKKQTGFVIGPGSLPGFLPGGVPGGIPHPQNTTPAPKKTSRRRQPPLDILPDPAAHDLSIFKGGPDHEEPIE